MAEAVEFRSSAAEITFRATNYRTDWQRSVILHRSELERASQ